MVRQNVSFVGTILFYTVILSGMALPPLLYVRYVQVTTWYNDVMAIPDRDDGDDHVEYIDPTANATRIEKYGKTGILVTEDYTGRAKHLGWFSHNHYLYQPDNYTCNGCNFCDDDRRCGGRKNGHFPSGLKECIDCDRFADCDDCDGQ